MLGIVRLTRRQVVDLLFEQNIFCPLPAATEVLESRVMKNSPRFNMHC